MSTAIGTTIYDELGVRPLINARGNATVLGGSRLSPRVLAAMEQANRYFVDMDELLERAGQRVARLLGAEAAYITSGASGALALGTAACMTGLDGEKMVRLPDTTGMPNQVLIQRRHRYAYDRCVTIVGARLVEVGDENGTTPEHLAAAIGPQTAAVLYPAHLEGRPGTLPLAEVLAIARARGVPVLLDAAAQVYPLEKFLGYQRMGVDLVCYGAKYFGGPNSAGLLCGRADLVKAAAMQGFIGFETSGYRTFGRPLKVDRQEVVAVVVALEEWLTMDHAARLAAADRKVRAIAERLADLPGVVLQPLPEGGPATRLRVVPAPGAGWTAAAAAQALRAGNPGIVVPVEGEALLVGVTTLADGEEEIVGARLRAVLAT